MNNNNDTTRFSQILALLNIDEPSVPSEGIKAYPVTFSTTTMLKDYIQLAEISNMPDYAVPFMHTVYAGKNMTVSAANPLIINPEKKEPVIVHAETITLQAGAKILCNTAVIITAETFIKN